MVYGIDERFGRFHGVDNLIPNNRDAFLSPALASELGAKAGDAITLRVARPTDIPLSTLQGRKEVTGQRIRLNIARVLDRASLGEFSLAPSQGPVLALYVPMARLQRDLDLGDRANMLLVKGVGDHFDQANFARDQLIRLATLDDLGLRMRKPVLETGQSSRAAPASSPTRSPNKLQDLPTSDGRPNTSRPDLRRQLDQDWRSRNSLLDRRSRSKDFVDARPGANNDLPRSTPIWLNEWAAEDLEREDRRHGHA